MPTPNKGTFFGVTPPPPQKKGKENSIKPAMHTVQLTKPSFRQYQYITINTTVAFATFNCTKSAKEKCVNSL